MLWPAVLTFLLTPLLIGRLHEDRYGLYLLLFSVSALFGLASLGVGDATVRYVSRYQASQDLRGVNRIMGTALLICVTTSSLMAVVMITFAPQVAGSFKMDAGLLPLATDVLRILSVGFWLSAFSDAVLCVATAVERYDIAGKVNLVIATVNAALTVLLLESGYGVRALAGLTAIRALLVLCIAGYVVRRLIPGIRLVPVWDTRGVKEVFGFGFFSFVNQIICMLAMHIDRLLLGWAFGVREVAYLTVPRQLLERGESAVGSAGSVLFPRFSALGDDAEALRRLYRDSAWALLCLSLVIFVPTTVLMPDLLTLWVGAEFAKEAAFTAQLIAACLATRGCFGAYFELLKGTGRIRSLTALFAGTTLIGVFIAIPLLLHFGLNGAGYRVWVLAWTGYVILAVVWRKLLAGTFSDIFVAVGEPLAVALVLAVAMVWLRGVIHTISWPVTIGLWGVFCGVLAAGLGLMNAWRYGSTGPALRLAGTLKVRFLGRKAGHRG
ncbi:MAG: hypothetical protein A3K19_16440 [Lentisphaerae bacterium RIFOXYB12_FULL_65_16]|nr:MAG: hypothetical protein A3K18_32870 [Lentisphaerae bacterium RIFOXYA12_64_32]OGV89032.1 MAG: hypothetical protein A3K19_16440 [Lentisphaerae bacterium RIFOXYB12_FULL_65_16]